MRRAAAGTLRRSRRGARTFGPLRVTRLSPAGEKGFSVLHVSIEPGGRAPAILHRRTAEFFLVLAGGSRGRLGGRPVRFRKGDFAHIPPGTAHQFTAGPEGTELLDVFVPALDLDDPDIVELER